MILHNMRHTLWTGISETNVNFITSAKRIHVFNNNKGNQVLGMIRRNEICDRTRQIESLVGEFHYELRAITTVH